LSDREYVYCVKDECASKLWATALAECLEPGDVVALSGELGVGKSVLARAMMRALGVRDDALPSPTYAIIQEYQGHLSSSVPCQVAHMDLYRLEHMEEVELLGIRDFLAPPWICLIEWAERMRHLLPASMVQIRLVYVPDQPLQRKISLSGVTAEKYAARLPADMLCR